jgi:succinyl-diaminopimelate desuccinylase
MRPEAPVEAILALLAQLVSLPSRAGEDDPAAICQALSRWLDAHGLPHRLLTGPAGRPLGLYAELRGTRAGPWTVLDAPLDTAGFGALADWQHPPTAARQADGWLQGRGSADAKAAVAIFCHLLQELARAPAAFAGRIGLLLDADEHSGRFGGARAFFEPGPDGGDPPRPDGVLIGYPGMDRIVRGCRGFVRARLVVQGIAAHAGATRSRGVNAIGRALALGQALDHLGLPGPTPAFPLPPQLTLTGVTGGSEHFSLVPDRCELRLDIRLTPAFDDSAARQAVRAAVAAFDAAEPAVAATQIDWLPGWPAYCLPDEHPLLGALRGAAAAELGQAPPAAVVGPSNIGNYLATLGIPALCGFGVQAEGLHAANERIAIDSIGPVYRIYREALRRLHGH